MARVLVIDDEAEMRATLEHALKKAGHDVVLATNGCEGIARHEESPVDLVITDLVMPVREGLETIVEFRKNHPEVAVIAMSGRTPAPATLSVARRLGATAVLEKPFLPAQLLAAVENALKPI